MEQQEISPVKHQEITLKTSENSIKEVERFIDSVCEGNRIEEEYYGNILIALTEAVNNAIFHGNKNDPSKNIYLSVDPDQNDRKLIFKVKDEGNGFDPNNVPDPTTKDNLEKSYGRGIFLMYNLADEVEFLDEGREVQITFNININ